MSSRTRSLLIGSFLLLAASPAAAQDDFVKKEAEQRFHEGTALMDQAKYEQARAKLLQAYATGKVPNVTFNLARVELLTGRHLEATRHFREYLRTADPRKVTPQEREKIDGWLKEATAYIARLDISAPSGASVTVDGEGIGIAPLKEPYDVARGRHAVVAQLDTKRLTADVDAPAGNTTRVVLQEENPSKVSVAITNGEVGRDVVPPREPDPGYWTATKIGGVVALGVSAVAGIAGGLLLNASGDKAAEGRRATSGLATCVDVSSPACDEGRSSQRATGTLMTGGWVAIAGAGALAVTGVVLFVWPTRDRSSSARTNVEIRGTGLGLTHRF